MFHPDTGFSQLDPSPQSPSIGWKQVVRAHELQRCSIRSDHDRPTRFSRFCLDTRTMTSRIRGWNSLLLRFTVSICSVITCWRPIVPQNIERACRVFLGDSLVNSSGHGALTRHCDYGIRRKVAQLTVLATVSDSSFLQYVSILRPWSRTSMIEAAKNGLDVFRCQSSLPSCICPQFKHS